MKKVSYISLSCLCALAAVNSALAEDKTVKIRDAENCFNVDWVPEYGRKFAKLKPDRIDTVSVFPVGFVRLENSGEHYPDRYFIRDRSAEIDLAIGADGQLIGLEKLLEATDTVELCHADPKRAGLPFDADGISLDMDMEIQFINRSGVHKMEELRDGLADGKPHYKKAAGVLSFLVPKMSHVMIKPVDQEASVQFAAMRGQTKIDLPEPIMFCGLPMIKYQDLKDLGADRLEITNGAYRLMPVPGLAMMKRFAGCDQDE